MSVNGRTPGWSSMEISLAGKGSTIGSCRIQGFELDEPQPDEQNPVPVGEVKELTLKISVTADGMENPSDEATVTLRMDELQLPQYGTPYEWIGETGLSLRPEWTAHYEGLRNRESE